MATLYELFEIARKAQLPVEYFDVNGDPIPSPVVLPEQELLYKIQAAMWVKAEDYLSGNLPVDDQERVEANGWAQKALTDPRQMSLAILRALLGANSSSSVAAILAASDGVIQTQLDSVVTLFARGSAPGRV